MAETAYKTKAASWKKDLIKSMAENIKGANTVAVLNMKDLPSRQLQVIKEKIDPKVDILMSRKTLMSRALESSGRDKAAELIQHFKGMPAIITSELDAFSLWALLKSNMSPSAAKGGQEAPFDIIVPAGMTNFAPGPILGELGDVGIKAGINAGKIEIKADSEVAKEGDIISAQLAALLERLDIKPMKIGLNLVAALEDGTIFMRSELDVDSDEVIAQIKSLHIDALKLAVGTGLINKETAEIMLQNAEMDAMKLAYSQGILADKVKELVLSKADAVASTLKEKVGEVPAEDQKEDKDNAPETEEHTEEKQEAAETAESETPQEEESSSDNQSDKE
ncbi:MAG: 50S ribosomal protein L10 [Candidatus Nanoarchaeia archaeon]|jgi:large subunit ribosomal protein L10|nr:50S ribosomal protein L10 [Candidatus Nanoarchaeia archaeon]|tara:strand:+ start:10425 stop:11432 length:1008 start_codon:yes stop_codon:yes gene_type:complete